MIVRQNLYTSPGGDTTQIDMTAKFLRSLKVEVDILLAESLQEKQDYDIYHFFNIIRPDDILPFIINSDIPFVVSTIFVDYYEYETKSRTGVLGFAFRILTAGQIEYVKAMARSLKDGIKIKSKYYLLHGHLKAMQFVAKKAKMLLPNSNSEYSRLSTYLHLNVPYRPIVNAINPDVFNIEVLPDNRYENHVICVGRIEGRKNQLNLIKAFVGTNINVTLIGKPSPNHMNYYEECKTIASGSDNIRFIDHLNHDQLVRIYKAAKVHILPSWFETTGLSSLEAGVMSCNIVVTDKGDTKEYYKDMAYYCDPDDINSIKDSVLQALKDDVNPTLRDYILANYTWQDTANQTLEAYNSVLQNVI